MDNELLDNLDKIHTTELVVARIRKNLCLDAPDVVEWCNKEFQPPTIYSARAKTGMCAPIAA